MGMPDDERDLLLPAVYVLSPVESARRTRRQRLALCCHRLVVLVTSLTVLSMLYNFFMPFAGGPGRDWDPDNSLSSQYGGPPSTPEALKSPVDFPLEQCKVYLGGAVFRDPVATRSIVFGGGQGEAKRRLVVGQNISHGRSDGKGGHWRHVHVSGDVVFRRGSAKTASSLEVEILRNDERIRTSLVDADDKDGENTQAEWLSLDDRIWVESGDGDDDVNGVPCLAVRMTVWLPEEGGGEVWLDSLAVETVHLHVQLAAGLGLNVVDNTHLGSVVGHIVTGVEGLETAASSGRRQGERGPSPSLTAGRALEAKTVAGEIRGPFELPSHVLVLHSVSGDVAVDVVEDPSKKEKKTGAQPLLQPPVEVKVSTVSGDVLYYEASADLAPHALDINSKSGVIAVTGAHFAEAARFHTVSGDLNLRISVLSPPTKSAASTDGGDDDKEFYRFETATISGETTVELLYDEAAVPLDFLRSSHQSISGDMDLVYPDAWTGHIRVRDRQSRFGRGGGRDDYRGGDGKDDRSSLQASSVSGLVELSFSKDTD